MFALLVFFNYLLRHCLLNPITLDLGSFVRLLRCGAKCVCVGGDVDHPCLFARVFVNVIWPCLSEAIAFHPHAHVLPGRPLLQWLPTQCSPYGGKELTNCWHVLADARPKFSLVRPFFNSCLHLLWCVSGIAAFHESSNEWSIEKYLVYIISKH